MEDDARYERTESGLLVPKAIAASPESPTAPSVVIHSPSDQLTRWLNFAGLAIQAVTVAVLWLTFKNTVIPTQQKELLAEQVSQLEIDKKRTLREVVAAKAALSHQKSELTRLANEATKLQSDSARSKAALLSANRSALEARARESIAHQAERAAKAGLTDARWRIFTEEATFVMYRPILDRAYNDAMVASDKLENSRTSKMTDEQRIIYEIDYSESHWPNYAKDVESIASEIRSMRSPHYTTEMTNEFANYFVAKGKKFSCKKPDFNSIKSRYRLKLSEAQKEAKEKAERYIDGIIKSYKDKKQEILITTEFRRQTYASYEISIPIVVKLELSKELRRLPEECDERFAKLGDDFIEAKNKSPLQTPKGMTL